MTIHPTIAQALAPFAPANSQLIDPAPQEFDPIRRDELREAARDLQDIYDDWGK